MYDLSTNCIHNEYWRRLNTNEFDLISPMFLGKYYISHHTKLLGLKINHTIFV